MAYKKVSPEHWLHSIRSDEDFLIKIINYEKYNPKKNMGGGWFKMQCSLPFSKKILSLSNKDSFSRWLYVCLLSACSQHDGSLPVNMGFLGKLTSILKVSLPDSLLKLQQVQLVRIERLQIDREIDRCINDNKKTTQPEEPEEPEEEEIECEELEELETINKEESLNIDDSGSNLWSRPVNKKTGSQKDYSVHDEAIMVYLEKDMDDISAPTLNRMREEIDVCCKRTGYTVKQFKTICENYIMTFRGGRIEVFDKKSKFSNFILKNDLHKYLEDFDPESAKSLLQIEKEQEDLKDDLYSKIMSKKQKQGGQL